VRVPEEACVAVAVHRVLQPVRANLLALISP
jgi:hypothetical protein